MDAQLVVEKALNLANARLAEAPAFPLYSSIVAQLDYLTAVLDGSEKNKLRLKEIIIGHYGAREFEEIDPEFAQALMEAQLIASKLAKGIKV